MEQSKTAVKSKTNKRIGNKTVKAEKPTVIEAYGLVLTLDDSLSKYANDPFFIEHARKVDERFAKKKL